MLSQGEYKAEGIKFASDLKPLFVSVMLVIYYFFRSLVLRGPVAHLKLVLGELYYERKFGLSTSGFKISSSKENYHYQAAAYIPVLAVLNNLFPESKQHSFMDIGCGKGRVMILAGHVGFNTIRGLDLDPELLNEARTNINFYSRIHPGKRFELQQQNALNLVCPGEACVFFMFNPFGPDVLAGVLDQIIRFSARGSFIIYMNPKHADVFRDKGLIPFRFYKRFLYTEAIVYKLNA